MRAGAEIARSSGWVAGLVAGADRLIRGVLVGGIQAYRLILSPWLGPACRFEPSCSQYAIEAVERHGVWRGIALAVRRLGRCHPLGGVGYDPVP